MNLLIYFSMCTNFLITSSFSANFSMWTPISFICSVILLSMPIISSLSPFLSNCLVIITNRSSEVVYSFSILPPILSRPLLSTRVSSPDICVMILRTLSVALTLDYLRDSWILFMLVWFCSILSTWVLRWLMTSGEVRLFPLVTVFESHLRESNSSLMSWVYFALT